MLWSYIQDKLISYKERCVFTKLYIQLSRNVLFQRCKVLLVRQRKIDRPCITTLHCFHFYFNFTYHNLFFR